MSIDQTDGDALQLIIDHVSEEVVNEIRDELAEEVSAQIIEELQDLEPISPQEGIQRFLEGKKKDEVKDLSQYETKMGYLEEFLVQELELENLNNLTSRQIDIYEEWRRYDSLDRDDPLAVKTLRDDMYLVKDFVEYMIVINGVPASVKEGVSVPVLKGEQGICKTTLDPERASEILDYLDPFEYASVEHVVILLFCKTGRRPCDIQALDLEDFTYNGAEEDSQLEFQHRPDTGTPLKEGKLHEAVLDIKPAVAKVIDDYIKNNREEVTEESGREPLLTSSKGNRLAKGTMQKYAYKWTRPGAIGNNPEDHDVENCEGMQSANEAYKCSKSRSPAMIRSGYITQKLNNASYAAVGHRVGATEEVLRKHYDHPDNEEEKERYRDEVAGTGHEDESGYAN